jgi:hypothetical protein
MAMVASTIPKFGPKCPPCRLARVKSAWRISSASAGSSSIVSFFTSSGLLIVSIYINIHSSFSYQFLLFFSFVRIDDTISPGVNSKSRASLNIFLFSFHQTRMALFSYQTYW